MAEPLPREDKFEAIQQYFSGFREILKEHAKPPGWQWRGTLDFIETQGQLTDPTPLNVVEENFMKRVLDTCIQYQRVKECYRNALNFAAYGDMISRGSMKVTYGEGMACPDLGIPVEHAVMLLNGKAIDPTWSVTLRESKVSSDTLLERIKYNLSNHAYYMVSFPTLNAVHWAERTGAYGIIDMNRTLMVGGIAGLELELRQPPPRKRGKKK
jgi:hypothetical protein